eukprot:8873743-Pyramimonas_sp.AAC.1
MHRFAVRGDGKQHGYAGEGAGGCNIDVQLPACMAACETSTKVQTKLEPEYAAVYVQKVEPYVDACVALLRVAIRDQAIRASEIAKVSSAIMEIAYAFPEKETVTGMSVALA